MCTILRFNPDDFYAIFHSAFNSVYKKFKTHISQYLAHSLFRACSITEFSNPSDELLQEWVIYCEF
ncbi:hypothetical protein C1645_837370 [Glomus cerebriforme]|uniref:Uncharacterized protein n=1 Tax=Glomus cerebriforme TaxID=658196 RepID=A0A397S8X8_9GLOM|nr:hypothetical protein C1645_837370 [Glomus cerebriforme]